MIPIIIICHNNGWMVEKTINDIYNKFKKSTFVIIDNASTKERTLQILQKLSTLPRIIICRFTENIHPRQILLQRSLYKYTKNPYVLTDPDLDLSNIPEDTLDVLLFVAMKYKKFKIGLALDISDEKDIIPGVNLDEEKNFWINKIEDPKYELYDASIDTTFCLIFNQMTIEMKDFFKDNIRIAGPYKVKHLPYHKSYIDSLDKQDYEDYYNNNNKEFGSTTSIINRYVESKN
jgi:hypothetical protein